MESGSGVELDAQGNDSKRSSDESVGEGRFSGTDVDRAVLLVRNLKLRGSLTAADRPRPASSVERGSNVGSKSLHTVGSQKPAGYADVGYVRPHHSRANVNVSQQMVNENAETAVQGDLSTVESSKSDTQLNVKETLPDDSLANISSFIIANAVTLASAKEMVCQSNSSNPVFGSQLNKCNSSSKTYDEAGVAEANAGISRQRSLDDSTGKQSPAAEAQDKSVAGTAEGKKSSHSMLGRIKNLTNCLSSSDEGRSREDMTASSEDSIKRRLISKIPRRKKTKKRKKHSSGGEEAESRSNSDEKTSSGTEVGLATAGREVEATVIDKTSMTTTEMDTGRVECKRDVSEPGYEKEVEKEIAKPEFGTGKEAAKEVITQLESSEEGLPNVSPPDVLKEIQVTSNKEDSAADQSSAGSKDARSELDEQQEGAINALASHHSGSSIELLCEYDEHANDGEPVLSAIVASDGAKTSPSSNSMPAVERKDLFQQKIMDASDAKQVHHHASAPMTLNQMEDVPSQQEIALKAVRERYRILSEQISDAIPGVSIDDKLRLAVLGSFSYAAKSGEHQELTGRRAASAPGPLEHVAQYLVEEFNKDHLTESGISSFDGTYCDESSNHHHGTPKVMKQESASIKDQSQDKAAGLTSSSDSSQDGYVQQMERAQRLRVASQTAPSPPKQLRPCSAESGESDKSKDLGDVKLTAMDSSSKSPRNTKGGNISNGSILSVSSSGYGSTLQAKIAEIEANLSISEGLGKPYKVDIPMEQDSVRKKELGYILKMLQKDGPAGSGGQGSNQSEDGHWDPALLEAAISYLYWSRHDAQDLLRKPQQHQKVVMEDKLEAQSLKLDLPPHSFRGSDTLEELKAELELKLKQTEDAIAKTKESGLTHLSSAHGMENPQLEMEEAHTAKPQEMSVDDPEDVLVGQPLDQTPPSAEAKNSTTSTSSSEDNRPPNSFHYNQSVALMSPGGALGSGILQEECQSARRVRKEADERIAKLQKEIEAMALQMKDQRMASVQLEAHLLSQLTTLTGEYQNLMAHDREHKALSKELKLKLDKKQQELKELQLTHHQESAEDVDSSQLQSQLDALAFKSKETIYQLGVRLSEVEQEKLMLETRLRQETARQERLREKSRRREQEATREQESMMEELQQEQRKCIQLDDELTSRTNDLHQMAASLQGLEKENRAQADEIRRLHRGLDASHQGRVQLEQELQRANQRLDAKHEQWKKQRQDLKDHLEETRTSLEKSQVYIKTLTQTNQRLTGTTSQLQSSYQALTTQLHMERLSNEVRDQDLERMRGELETERKSRSEQVTSQLSKWQLSLQNSTQKLSDALKNKICNQQRDLQLLRASNNEQATDHLCDNRRPVPMTSGVYSPRHHIQTSTPSCQRTHPGYILRHQHQATQTANLNNWTHFNTEGGVRSMTPQGRDSSNRQHSGKLIGYAQ